MFSREVVRDSVAFVAPTPEMFHRQQKLINWASAKFFFRFCCFSPRVGCVGVCGRVRKEGVKDVMEEGRRRRGRDEEGE